MLGDNTHSRLVSALKVALPLTALVLLSMLFLLSRGHDPDAALPYAQVDIGELLREPRLTAPTYSGVTRDGDEVVFSAETAFPGAPATGNGARALAPLLRLIAPDGGETRVAAQEARIDPGAGQLVLAGAVRVETPEGYRIDSAEVQASLDRSELRSPGAVTATGPQGQIEAGGFTLTRGAEPGREVLVFNGGVKLLYQPQTPLPPPVPAP
ncbi:lipopolysaccharide export system protein LptC [Gemmobacter megaterium]|uniref:Lipopolysaccharide export system protein LptC n=2 Tax=Gemmobacter megaterium TaxID=1086013 RepID=A0A1N7NYZ5_9RHOB|nr:lipopolysaccharide export system protein LptC [Gemmobacter megaterium]